VRDLQFTAPGTGENTRSPEQFVNQLIKKLDDTVIIRALATHLTSDGSKTLGIPSLDADPADADWTTELLTGALDATMAFGKRVMQPNPLAKQLKVSKDLLRFSALPIEALVRERLAYKFAITLEKAYMTGSGVGQPLGLFVASANGIPTSRDVATGNLATGVTFDGLISAKYFLKAGYQATAQWLFHRDIVATIAKLKDLEGRYVWQPAVVAGQPDTILGRPVLMTEYAPNTIATALYVGMFGDFSFYWIADSMEFLLERLNELYAATNQVGFIGRLFSDGAPVLGEAFARIKLG
jgi:HK97 family phage major capsid protein